MRVSGRGADESICTTMSQALSLMWPGPGFTHTSVCGAPQACQRVLFPLNTLSGPAEFRAPLYLEQWSRGLHPQGPWLCVCVCLPSEGIFGSSRGQGHAQAPWVGSITWTHKAASIAITEIATEMLRNFSWTWKTCCRKTCYLTLSNQWSPVFCGGRGYKLR